VRSESLRSKERKRGVKQIKIEALAKSVGLGAYYDSVYRLLSQDVHSQVRSLEDYVSTGSDGEIGNIEWGPREQDVPTCLATGTDVLLRSWMAVDQLFKVGIQAEIQKYIQEYERIHSENNP
jgi:Family of unknown function (DUF5677)